MIFNVNISIIAHVDHGKTKLFNSIISFSKNFYLYNKNFYFYNSDNYTIKCNFLTLVIKNKIFNFIDCPGHFDFLNEIYKTIYISDYCLLIIDLIKGIEIQTLFCFNLAVKFKKKILIFLSKSDLYLKFNSIKYSIKKNFGVKIKINFISAKFYLGFQKIFEIKINNKYTNNTIIFLLDILYHLKLGKIIFVKKISGILKINDILFNNKNEKIKIIKIGILNPKNFFLKKIKFNGIYFLIIHSKFILTNFYYNNYNNFTFYNFNNSIIYNIYLENDYYLIILINNDMNIKYNNTKSEIFGKGYIIEFMGELHSKIIFKKLSYFNKFWVTNFYFTFLVNKNNFWFFDKISFKNNYEQLMNIKFYVVKKNLFKMLKKIFCFSVYKIKINYFENLFSIDLYITLYNLQNNFFNYKFEKIFFFEFYFHHFVLSKLKNIMIIINNKKYEEANFMCLENEKIICENYFNKILFKIKKKLFDIKIQFFDGKKVLLTKIIKSIKKNVIDKCYGGDITRKLKLINKQKIGKQFLNEISNYIINEKLLKRIISNENSNF